MSKALLHQELKHKFLLERFLNRGITKTQDGIDLRLLTYVELKSESVLQVFRDIDSETDSSKWF